MNVTVKERAAKTSAWLLYTLIVLEILFMVSPFAAYYYSIYATPLNVLQEFQSTAWLTMYLLPHFSYTDSWLANGLLLVSWPLILLGIVLFVLGFCQIYWSKFTRNGAVEAGLYRHIRHPQYAALAVVGLGCSLYWSRFIVVIAYVSMLCLYYFLARVEERICLQKFGDSYREYLAKTGMFLPRKWEEQLRLPDWRISEKRWVRTALSVGLYIALIVLTAGVGQLLRNHVVDSIQTNVDGARVTVFMAPVSKQTEARITRLMEEATLPGDIAYVAPASWHIPELGLNRSSVSPQATNTNEFLHPSTHGNSLSVDKNFSVALTEAIYAEKNVKGIKRFSRALDVRPIAFVEIDLDAGTLVRNTHMGAGQWAGVPVPTF